MVFLFCQASLTLLVHVINHLQVGPLVPQLSLQGPVDLYNMVGFAAISTFLLVCRVLSGCMSFPEVLLFVTPHGLTFMFLVFCQMTSNFFAALILLSAIFWALYKSSLCTQINTYLLMVSSRSFNIATSLNISSVTPWSLSPPINCSVRSLSYSQYLYLVTNIHSLLIHSWADSLLFLYYFQ